ncbi:MAG: PIN domain-containing protein [Acidobacteriota bacterium]
MRVFADTSGLYAVLDRDDRFHDDAVEVWRGVVKGGRKMLTSSYVLVECSALVQRRLGMDALRDLLSVMTRVVKVRPVSARTHQVAVRLLLQENRRDLSLVDCVSFGVMHDLGLRHAFAFDPHFERFGFIQLRASALRSASGPRAPSP